MLLVPKVGLEPTTSCEDRILSRVLLPVPWYWKRVVVILKILVFKARTIPSGSSGPPRSWLRVYGAGQSVLGGACAC